MDTAIQMLQMHINLFIYVINELKYRLRLVLYILSQMHIFLT